MGFAEGGIGGRGEGSVDVSSSQVPVPKWDPVNGVCTRPCEEMRESCRCPSGRDKKGKDD